jgi:hypothetical protein
MKKSVMVHAGLLVASLAAAALTWTAEEVDPTDRATVSVWDRGAEEIVALSFRSGIDSVDVERRAEGGEEYLWGRQTTRAPDQAIPPPIDSVTGQPTTIRTMTEEYPVGEGGPELIERLARLRALRDLGAADSIKRATYGLAGTEPSLTIRFEDGSQRTLVFGNAVVGGGARYVLVAEDEHIYVLSADLVSPFEAGAGALRLTKYQPFQPEQVAAVTIRGGGAERTMSARQSGDMPPRTIWTFPGEDRQDVAFGIFMGQLDQLWVMRYRPEVEESSLETVMRADYVDERGRNIGFLEIFRSRPGEGAVTYYMRTPRTRVIGEIYGPQAERVEQDLRNQLRPQAGGAGA